MNFKWLKKKGVEAKTVKTAPLPERKSDEELRRTIDAKMSALRIRQAAQAALSTPDPLESTFETSEEDEDLVFDPTGSGIQVEEIEFAVSADDLDFGREVDTVKTAWGDLPVGEATSFAKENQK